MAAPNLDRYRTLLAEIVAHLAAFGDPVWPPRLAQWISELDALDLADDPVRSIVDHLKRTKRALGGMGSISDVYICPQAGHTIPDHEIAKANERLMELVELLYRETCNLLDKLANHGN